MIKKIAVIGTGVIGTGWIIRCLAHNKKVIVFDKDNIHEPRNSVDGHEKEDISGFVLLTGLGILDSAVRNATLILFPFILLERGMREDQ